MKASAVIPAITGTSRDELPLSAKSGHSGKQIRLLKALPTPVIDRHARDKLALAFRRYAAKRITNDELEDAVGWRSKDRGVTVVQDMAWQLYDDMFRHRAEGPHALSKDDRRSVARWVLFLRTDLEYLWPSYDFRQSGTSLDRFLADLFTARQWRKKKDGDWENFLGAGDFEVWPFLKKADEAFARTRNK